MLPILLSLNFVVGVSLLLFCVSLLQKVHCVALRLRLRSSDFRELQAASGEWINEYARGHESRRDTTTKEYLPASDIIRKSIRRSWTISSKNNQVSLHFTVLS